MMNLECLFSTHCGHSAQGCQFSLLVPVDHVCLATVRFKDEAKIEH
jgi:hypothetical protein